MYNDVYRCKATYSNVEVGQAQGVTYFSDTNKVKFSFIGNLYLFLLPIKSIIKYACIF